MWGAGLRQGPGLWQWARPRLRTCAAGKGSMAGGALRVLSAEVRP